MNITLNELREVFTGLVHSGEPGQTKYDNGMIGQYVIVRCRDAGVHAGYLESHHNRECVLTAARRLWRWKPATGKSWLSGVAMTGLHAESKISTVVNRIHLTENCEIIACDPVAIKSIQDFPDHE